MRCPRWLSRLGKAKGGCRNGPDLRVALLDAEFTSKMPPERRSHMRAATLLLLSMCTCCAAWTRMSMMRDNKEHKERQKNVQYHDIAIEPLFCCK